MGNALMLDPSLLLHKRSFGAVRASLEDVPEATYVVPASLYYAVFERVDVLPRFAMFAPPWNAADLDEVRDLLNDPRVSAFAPVESDSVDGDEFARGFYASLLATVQDDEFVASVLYEEWRFLTSESWIASRTKRAFIAFRRAGAAALELPRESFDRLARKTPGVVPEIDAPHPLTASQRLRAAAKWVAAGGSPATALIDPVLAAVLVGSTVNFFFLFDP